MSLTCEAEIGVQNELALRFTIVSKPTPVLEYIKTISSLVGASHILAVFEENDTLKVFFDDRRFIDSLIRSGIHVMGHHVRVDYVVPPGTKVVLSNVDPVISNFDLMRLLSIYGTIVSPIIRPPVSDDMEFCHIGYGVRYCYMTIIDPIPTKLEFRNGDQLFLIKILVGEEMALIPIIKSDICDLSEGDFIGIAGPSSGIAYADEESTSPVLVSVESAASESNSDLHLDIAKLPIKRNYVKGRGRPHKALKIKQTKVTATTRAAKKIKQNVKQKWIGVNRVKPLRRGKRGRKTLRLFKKSSSPPPTLLSLSPTSSSDVDDSLVPPKLITVKSKNFEGPLSEEKLQSFIDECKHNRTPIELAKKYLGSDCNNNTMCSLIEQLENLSRISTCVSLKLRLGRLIKLLTDSVNGVKS